MGTKINLTEAERHAILATLPHVPTEVVDEWLGFYARQAGWPPTLDQNGIPTGRWKRILLDYPLATWAALNWKKEEVVLREDGVHDSSLEIVAPLLAAYVDGVPNEFLEKIKDGPKRFQSIVAAITESGTVPGTLIAVRDGGRLRFADGHHRLAAYFYCAGLAGPAPPGLESIRDRPVSVWVGSAPESRPGV